MPSISESRASATSSSSIKRISLPGRVAIFMLGFVNGVMHQPSSTGDTSSQSVGSHYSLQLLPFLLVQRSSDSHSHHKLKVVLFSHFPFASFSHVAFASIPKHSFQLRKFIAMGLTYMPMRTGSRADILTCPIWARQRIKLIPAQQRRGRNWLIPNFAVPASFSWILC